MIFAFMQGDKFASSKPKENHISIIIMESGCWFVIWFINTLSFMVNWSQNNINCNKLKGTKICMYIIWNCDTLWTVIAIGYKECVLLKLKKKKQKKNHLIPKIGAILCGSWYTCTDMGFAFPDTCQSKARRICMENVKGKQDLSH